MKDRILKMYQNGNKAVQQALEAEFGKDFFVADITERVKTVEDAFMIVEKIKPDINKQFLSLLNIDFEYKKRMMAEFKLIVIMEALNEGWIPNWNDTKQPKWYPWFYIVGGFAASGAYAGLGYVYANYGAADSYTALGSRLCCSSKKLAEYAGKQFKDLYQDFYLG